MIWYLTSNYRIQLLVAIYWVGFGVHLAIEQYLDQRVTVSYYTEWILGSFGNWPVTTEYSYY